MNWNKLKNYGLFLAAACVMIFGYNKQADNKRSVNRNYTAGETRDSHEPSIPIRVEGDTPEISSGTQ